MECFQLMFYTQKDKVTELFELRYVAERSQKLKPQLEDDFEISKVVRISDEIK